MSSEENKESKQDYTIIPSFSDNGKNIDAAIESAFLKYLKYNDYK